MAKDKASDDNSDNDQEKINSHVTECADLETMLINSADQKTWLSTQEIHFLSEEESATHIALQPDYFKDLQSNGLAEKFELIDRNVQNLGNNVPLSYIDGLKAVSMKAKDAKDAETKQAEFSINYILRKAGQFLQKANEPFFQ